MLVVTKSFAQEFRGGEIWFSRIDQNYFDVFVDVYYKGIGIETKPFLRIKCTLCPVDTAKLISNDSFALNMHKLRYKGRFLVFEEDVQLIVSVLDTFYLPELKNLSGDNKGYYFLRATWTAQLYQFFGDNSPPVFANPPTAFTFENGVFAFDSRAIDPDQDTIFYGFKDYNLIGTGYAYTMPAASDSVYCDFLNGAIIWNKPEEAGKYLVGMIAAEYTPGALYLGYSERDMIFEITEADLLTKTADHKSSDLKLSISPNPAHEALQISISRPDNQPEVMLTVWDIFGKMLYNKMIPESQLQHFENFDIGDWIPGVYCFILSSNGLIMEEKKVVVF